MSRPQLQGNSTGSLAEYCRSASGSPWMRNQLVRHFVCKSLYNERRGKIKATMVNYLGSSYLWSEIYCHSPAVILTEHFQSWKWNVIVIGAGVALELLRWLTSWIDENPNFVRIPDGRLQLLARSWGSPCGRQQDTLHRVHWSQRTLI